MNNVKILRALIGFFALAIAVDILIDLYVLIAILGLQDGPSYLVGITALISIIKNVLLLPSLVFLFLAVHYFIKNGYFNRQSANKLKLCGIFLIANSVLSYLSAHLVGEYAINKLNASEEHPVKWLSGLPGLFILLVTGFGLYTLSDFISKGEAIERENELTI